MLSLHKLCGGAGESAEVGLAEIESQAEVDRASVS